jgi:hypothetical protein
MQPRKTRDDDAEKTRDDDAEKTRDDDAEKTRDDADNPLKPSDVDKPSDAEKPFGALVPQAVVSECFVRVFDWRGHAPRVPNRSLCTAIFR